MPSVMSDCIVSGESSAAVLAVTTGAPVIQGRSALTPPEHNAGGWALPVTSMLPPPRGLSA